MPDARTNHPTPQQLTKYGLGTLPAAERASIHAHVAGCPECRRKVESQFPDSFIGQHRGGAPAGRSILPTLPSLPESTALHGRRSAESPGDVPAELAESSKYEILGKLGEGGMGAVYKARHTFLGELVAIKVMTADVGENPEARSRFLREMLAAGQLKHPNIVRALDAEQIGDLLVLVMEFVPGITLDRLVKQRGPLPVDFACHCIAQAAMGLQHAHEKGMVHRDIKPANLMVTAKEKEVKVLDFGLVRGPSVQTGTRQTQLQAFMGTPEYVAPEQAGDARNADIRADVYSLGCTLYFLLAGRPPFKKDTIFNTIMAQVQDEARPLTEVRKDVPAELAAVVAKMMAKKPIARYQTPLEAARALRPFVGEGQARGAEARPVAASAAITPGPPPRPALPPLPVQPLREKSKVKRKRPAWKIAAAAACGLGMIALLSLGVLALRTGKSKKAVVPVSRETPKQVAAVGNEKPPVRPEDALVKPVPKKPEVKTPAPKDVAPAETPTAITNSIGMKLVRIPAGTFTMGSSKQEQDTAIAENEKTAKKKLLDALLSMYRSESPQHEVEITKAFWLGIHEVTQGQFKAVMGSHPSFFSKDGESKAGLKYLNGNPAGSKDKVPADTSDFPVENVCHDEAVEFCTKLSALAAERGRVYRLPSEAEWEYACRGGANPSTLFHTGNSLSSSQANFDGSNPYGGAARGVNLARTTKVGSYKANAFGLYDMHGNVWEWCADCYDKDYYAKSPRRDPPGPSGRSDRVSRGGGWDAHGQFCRSAFRFRHSLACRHNNVGFRVALVLSSGR